MQVSFWCAGRVVLMHVGSMMLGCVGSMVTVCVYGVVTVHVYVVASVCGYGTPIQRGAYAGAGPGGVTWVGVGIV